MVSPELGSPEWAQSWPASFESARPWWVSAPAEAASLEWVWPESVLFESVSSARGWPEWVSLRSGLPAAAGLQLACIGSARRSATEPRRAAWLAPAWPGPARGGALCEAVRAALRQGRSATKRRRRPWWQAHRAYRRSRPE